MNGSSLQPTKPRRQLTVFDATCIIVGIIIGSGIFRTPSIVAGSLGDPWLIIGAWLLGGLLALIGALCYAELTTTYPRQGGDYVYLSRAYGPRTGFLFAWAEFWIIRPGSTGPMAFVFGQYAHQLYPLGTGNDVLCYAVGSIVMITLLNAAGMRSGKWTQNVLTTIKVLALLAIFVAALLATPANNVALVEGSTFPPLAAISFAMLMVMFTFGGWNDMAFVSAEVRDPNRNLVRSLVIGTSLVTLVYVLVNLAYLRVLGVAGLAGTTTPATSLMQKTAGDLGGQMASALICISALGAINGMIFTGARVYHALGEQLPTFRWLAHWNNRVNAPVRSIVLQSVVILAVVVGFGSLNSPGNEKVKDFEAFEQLVIFGAPCFWLFLLLVGIGLFVLRHKDSHLPRSFRVPFYPVLPAIFCLGCLFMVYSTVPFMIQQLSNPAMLAKPAFLAILISTGIIILAGALLAWLKVSD
jgi:amino acid transporter